MANLQGTCSNGSNKPAKAESSASARTRKERVDGWMDRARGLGDGSESEQRHDAPAWNGIGIGSLPCRVQGQLSSCSRGPFGTLLSSAWLVSPRQALAGLAECMQLGIVWLLGSKEPGWCELLFGYLYG